MSESDCAHQAPRKVKTDEVKVNREWRPSTRYEACSKCGQILRIMTATAAFMSDDAPRRAGEWRDV